MINIMNNPLSIALLMFLLFRFSYQICTSTVAITACSWDSLKSNTPLRIKNYKTYLSISHGNLELIPRHSFKFVPLVAILEINNNKLQQLEDNTFDGLSSLTELYLYNNQIQMIEKNVFKQLKYLEKLDLGMNRISEIHSQCFASLSNLKYLNLAFNSLKSVPSATISLKNLQIFNLANNAVENLHSNSFSTLTKLEYLMLNDNKLKMIENGSFNGLSSLLKLDISSNYLSNLNVDDLRINARKLSSVKISINSFKCDILIQIVTKFKRNNVEVSRGFSRSSNNIDGISCTT